MKLNSSLISLARRLLLTPLVGFWVGAFIVFTLLQLYFITTITYKYVENETRSIAGIVEKGLQYKNGTWDTTRYTSDPQTPHPSGSGGFSASLYIVTVDGFVIERTAPINGLLDSSDFSHLMKFQTPQTISLVTNDQWRVLSRPITHNNQTEGVMVVAFYNPQQSIQDSIDEKLAKNLDYIQSRIKVKDEEIDEEIDVSQVNSSEIDVDISFEIVSSFNKVLLNNGRMPTFIDRSYVLNQLEQSGETRRIVDVRTKKPYLVYSHPVRDHNNIPLGIIVVGENISFTDNIIRQFIPTMLLCSALLTLLFGVFAAMIIPRLLPAIFAAYDQLKSQVAIPARIQFDKPNSRLQLDGVILDIPYASNQYYLLEALFSAPNKRWEHDELLERFGEEETASKKVYDAALAVNKKVGFKLIEYKDKTFRINPSLISRL